MERNKIDSILDRYLQGTASVTEEQRIEKWLESIGEEPSAWTMMEEAQQQNFLNGLYADISKDKESAKVVPMRRWTKYIAAASVLLVLALAGWFLYTRNGKPDTELATRVTPADVPAPATSRAVITLADGSKVYLDSAGIGTIAKEQGVNLVKNGTGAISYELPANSQQLTTNSSFYNTLYNPRGSRVIDMQLSDGSHVWLNAGSSIKYPVAFVGNDRKVEITGEAYFEVAHNASKPFIVTKGEASITVLGTHFNVNAYDDEEALKVTLLEGSVRVTNSYKLTANSLTIKPGQQAVLTNSYQLTANSSVDLDEVMAWKNGQFSFNRTSIVSIMKQVERWYDVQVEFKDGVQDNDFTGGIARTENVSQVLKMLEKTGAVHFKIEEKKITVTK